MKINFKRLTAVLALCLTLSSGMALDLPVKTVNGTKYFYYKVGKKESVYGLSKKLGVSREDIVRNNPSAEDGVKKGQVLLFPFEEFVAEQPADVAGVQQSDVVIPAVDSDAAVGSAPVSDEQAADTLVTATELRSSVSLLLPFGLKADETSRQNKLALDLYKGFLLGLDTLASRKGDVEINVFDVDNLGADQIDALLDSAVVSLSAVIIVPDENIERAAAAKAVSRGNYVLNVFNVPDTLYLDNPAVIQGNTPQRKMYELAVDGMMRDFDGYTPVILRSREGRNEKESFTNYLAQRYVDEGIVPIVIEYGSNLLSSELDVLNGREGKFVIVPSSGSVTEFGKFAHVVRSFRDRMMMTEADEDGNIPEPTTIVALFGYPDWTAFRGDALDLLNKMEVTVYSRFCDNFSGFSAKGVEDNFRRWYGSKIIESVPSQAFLGFDTACMLVKNLRYNEGSFDPLRPRSFEGVQSVFDFQKSDNGYFNSSIYLIKYHTDGHITWRIL